jgi:hypothetical protein
VKVTQWHGCYNDSWQGVITPDAFAHPAKFAPGLISRILRHMLERGYIAPGDSIVDPFGGIAAGGYWAMLLGLHWTGIELEPRFVELGQRNIAKWQHDLRGLGSRLGTARLLQGDSRRLLEVVGGGAAGVVSSPPFESSLTTDSKLFTPYTGLGRYEYSPEVAERRKEDYGSTPGQLGSMPPGDYGAAVSSPPYADAVNGTGEGPGARYDTVYHNADTAQRLSSDNGYGDAPGQLGRMAREGFEAAVSSPPYEASHMDISSNSLIGTSVNKGSYGSASYGDSLGQLAETSGETFWAAARVICEQTYAALRPGGYAAWVCKDFVRKGQRVPFSDQWEQLCAAVGFEPVERIAAMLVDDHGSQLDIFGGATPRRTERKSFFRRLAEKKGSPRIDWEDVIIMRKPTRAHANGNGARSEP